MGFGVVSRMGLGVVSRLGHRVVSRLGFAEQLGGAAAAMSTSEAQIILTLALGQSITFS